ncbi:MAG: hypothetical protein J6C18_03290 [Bacteroidaceae bacterium]|nr:hypothetical protein [Bacteroidaceae bacterium]
MSIQAQTFPYRVVGIRRGEASTLEVELEYENPCFEESEDYRAKCEGEARLHGIGFNITVHHIAPHLFFPELDRLVLVQYAYDDEPLCDEYGEPIPTRYTLVEYQGLYPML